MRGAFITIEGIDGSGKSTFAGGLARELRRSGRRVAVTAEPTDTWLGDAVRRSWELKCGPAVEAHLFMADRCAHSSEIEKMLTAGTTVLCDRYVDSTLAYQGPELARSIPGGFPEAVAWLAAASGPDILMPDVTFLLDLEPRMSMERMAARPTKSKFERLRYLKGVRQAYIELSGDPRFVILDASRPIEELVAAASQVVRGLKCSARPRKGIVLRRR